MLSPRPLRSHQRDFVKATILPDSHNDDVHEFPVTPAPCPPQTLACKTFGYFVVGAPCSLLHRHRQLLSRPSTPKRHQPGLSWETGAETRRDDTRRVFLDNAEATVRCTPSSTTDLIPMPSRTRLNSKTTESVHFATGSSRARKQRLTRGITQATQDSPPQPHSLSVLRGHLQQSLLQ